MCFAYTSPTVYADSNRFGVRVEIALQVASGSQCSLQIYVIWTMNLYSNADHAMLPVILMVLGHARKYGNGLW